jgi:hypothetical protein
MTLHNTLIAMFALAAFTAAALVSFTPLGRNVTAPFELARQAPNR